MVALLTENVSPEDTDGLRVLQQYVLAQTNTGNRSERWVSTFTLLAVRRAVADAADRQQPITADPPVILEALHLLALGDYSAQGISAATGIKLPKLLPGVQEVDALGYLRSHGTSRRKVAKLAVHSYSGDHTVYRTDRPRIWAVAKAVVGALESFLTDATAVSDVQAQSDQAVRDKAQSSRRFSRIASRRVLFVGGLATVAAAVVLLTTLAFNGPESGKRDSSSGQTDMSKTGQIASGEILRIAQASSGLTTADFSATAKANIGDTLLIRERLDSVGPYAISRPTIKWQPTGAADTFSTVRADISGHNLYPDPSTAQATVTFLGNQNGCIRYVPGTSTLSLIDGSGEQRISDKLVTSGTTLTDLNVATYLVSAKFKVVDGDRCK